MPSEAKAEATLTKGPKRLTMPRQQSYCTVSPFSYPLGHKVIAVTP